jgi:pimeloyl-ACP methyl ester carboxylesterase
MSDLTPLLLIPGLLCDAALWRNQINSLKDIAESHVADTTTADGIEGMASHILAKAPPRFALAGLSMGGYISLQIMRMAPERVLKLALIDTSARPDTPAQTARRRQTIELAQAGSGQFKGVTPQLMPNLIHPDRIHDEALVAQITEMAERVGRDAFLRQQTAIMGRIDSRPFLKDIRVPTLVIGGKQDSITPPAILYEISESIAGAQLHIIEDCGHTAPLEQPVAVNRLMRLWLHHIG